MNIHLRANNQLAEIVVLSDKKETGIRATAMSTLDIPMTQIKNTPAILGEADILKTIQLMPGVQAGTEGFSGLYVRGGGPDQNLILLDGIPIYNADHMLGVFSIFTPEAMKKGHAFQRVVSRSLRWPFVFCSGHPDKRRRYAEIPRYGQYRVVDQ